MAEVSYTITWSKNPELIARILLGELPKTVEQNLMATLIDSANKIRNPLHQGVLRGPWSGKIYKRGKKEHRASAKGEPPATDTGELGRSIVYDIDNRRLQVEVGVHAGAPYAIYLDENDDNKSKWARRLVTYYSKQAEPDIQQALDRCATMIAEQIGMVIEK